MEKEQIIKLWKALEVTSVDFNFSCGGDSMNESDIVINTKNGTITNADIETYFDNEVYNKVEFYVNSDGHYQGESGVVTIELEGEGEEEDFTYYKNAESEWSEELNTDFAIKLTDKEAEFIKEKILNFNGDMDDINVVFKGDLILTNEDEIFLSELQEKILDEVRGYSPETTEGELEEWFSFNTDEDNLTINEDNELIINMSNRVIVYRESND
jgi:hypothetical protein